MIRLRLRDSEPLGTIIREGRWWQRKATRHQVRVLELSDGAGRAEVCRAITKCGLIIDQPELTLVEEGTPCRRRGCSR